ILDGLDLQARSGERLDSRLATGTRPLDAHVYAAHAHGQRFPGGLFGCHRRCERGALLGALETGLSGRTPGDRVPAGIRDSDRRVVEGSLNVRNALGVCDLLAPLRGIRHWKPTWSLSSC